MLRLQASRGVFNISNSFHPVGKITDDELETFRSKFFNAQDDLFQRQVDLTRERGGG